MDGGAWWAAVHGVARSRTGLSDFTFTFHFHALEKEMATHSSVLAWRIPGTGEPHGLPSTGSHRVGHDWSDLAAAAAAAGLPQWLRSKESTAIQEIQEMWVQYPGWEDPLEEETATHSSILAHKISWTEEPGRLQSMGLQHWTGLSNWEHMWLMILVFTDHYFPTPILGPVFSLCSLTLGSALWCALAKKCEWHSTLTF